jgi:uncharacterized membrane protein
LVVLVGLGLRLVDAGTRLSHDEGYSWLVASAGNPSAFLTRLAHYENTPPLFYLLLAPLPLGSEVWLRIPSIIAGVAMIPVLYAIVRPLLGTSAALLAALGLAVAPFAVSYSDYSRGFMVAGLGLLVALLAAQRLAAGARRRWWVIYAVAAIWAIYSEYYAVLYVLAIAAALIIIKPPRPREALVLGLAPLAALLPWIPELIRSQNDLGKTKLPFLATTPTPGLVRSAIVPLVFGEHGVANSTTLRDVQALLVVLVLAVAGVILRRRASRHAFWLLAGVLIIAALLQLVVTGIDTDIFRQRYMTALIPLGSAVIAGAVVNVRWRYASAAVAAVLLVLGVAIAVRRAGHEYEPDSPGAVVVAQAHGFNTVLTNSAVVAFYGRRIHVILDRPFGLGRGIEQSCAPRCAVIDDARFGGVRPGPGPRVVLGPIVVRFPPRG